jgi:hypothetical protein
MSRPTRLYALLIAVGFAAAGVIGLFYNNDFSTGANVTRRAIFGLLDTNGWHNLFHLTSVPIAFWVANRAGASRSFALLAGLLYAVMGVAGIAIGDDAVLVRLIPVNVLDSVIHLSLGVLGVAVAWYAAPARRPQPRYATGA